MKAIITRDVQRARKGTCVRGGGIELPCIYYIYAAKTYKKYMREKLKKQIQRKKFTS